MDPLEYSMLGNQLKDAGDTGLRRRKVGTFTQETSSFVKRTTPQPVLGLGYYAKLEARRAVAVGVATSVAVFGLGLFTWHSIEGGLGVSAACGLLGGACHFVNTLTYAAVGGIAKKVFSCCCTPSCSRATAHKWVVGMALSVPTFMLSIAAMILRTSYHPPKRRWASDRHQSGGDLKFMAHILSVLAASYIAYRLTMTVANGLFGPKQSKSTEMPILPVTTRDLDV